MDGRIEYEGKRGSSGAAAQGQKRKDKKQSKRDLPPHEKYPRYLTSEEERLAEMYKPTPSMLQQSLFDAGPLSGLKNKAAAPEIVEFMNVPNLQSTVPLHEPLFQPYPLSMQFRDYEEFGEHTQTLYFRNNDSVPRRVTVVAPDSQFFSLKPNPRTSDRVAPGMEVSYEVTFRPHGKREYHETLMVVTEREKFVVEVSALGPWSCMDFPDEIGFGTCPVNFRNERTFLVRNVGEQDAKFTVTATAPFDVSPLSGFVKLGGVTQVTVGFNAETCADHDGELEVMYDNGQKSYVHLHGSAKNVNVSIDKPIAELDPAYISLTSTTTIKIHNDSDQPVDFEWKSFANTLEDSEERARLHGELDRLEALEYEELEARVYEAVPELEDAEGEDGHGSSSGASSASESESEVVDGAFDSGLFTSSSSSSTIVPLAKQRDLAALRQKYKNLRHAVNEDPLLMSDENFRIEPLTGQVWSHSSREITVTFQPQIAADYSTVACLAVSGRENRLPLKALGRGIGPKAGFTFHIVDVGNVFINSRHKYELQLENRGDIECEYSLDDSESPFAKQIGFSPKSGVLEVENSHIICVDFCSSTLGEFSEQFTFSMKGSNDKLKVRLKGTVIGPTFHLNINELKFDRVAYGFCNPRTFNIYNTSAIPMEYALRVDKDTKFDEPEFVLDPKRGVIAPGQHQAVTLEFTSRTVGKYKTALMVDIEGIGANQLQVPIFAECAVANVTLIPSQKKRLVCSSKVREGLSVSLAGFDGGDGMGGLLPDGDGEAEETGFDDQDFCDSEEEAESAARDSAEAIGVSDPAAVDEARLEFGRCFLRHPYCMQLALRNSMDVRAHFEVLKQDESTFCIASYEPSVQEGVIEPLSEITIDVTIRTAKLGKLNLPLYVRILGSDSPPLVIDLVAFSLGPRLVLESPVVDFGSAECLKTAKKTFKIKNKSLIAAPYRAFLKSSKSRFAIELFEGCLAPGEKLAYPVSVTPDDTTLIKDELHIFVTDGDNIVVPLRAKGKGTTLFCSELEDLRLCKFGSVFTSRGHERKFLVENRGKREQLLTWFNKAIDAKTADRNKIITEVERMKKDKDKEVQKKAARTRIPPEPRAVFSLHPESVSLKPRTGCIFTVRAESDIPGQVLEQLVLESKVGKEKKAIQVAESTMSGNFINPLLETNVDVIEFCYTFSPEEEAAAGNGAFRTTHKQPFRLKNISQLALDFILRTQIPFTVDTFEISLEPGEEKEVQVMFDPFVSDELKTQTILSKLTAVHKNHPQQDAFEIRAQINFPNLEFEYDQVDFGCIVNDTTKTAKVKITNSSIIDTMFSWAFVEDDDGRGDSSGGQGRPSSGKASSQALLPRLAPNEVFDIRPFRGMLRPGESQYVEVSFFGHANRKFNVNAVCEVEGGPEYELVLKGEASQVNYRLDQTSLDFGDLVHDKSEEQHFTIFNTSKVAFAYRAISSRADVVSCTPSEGRIFAKDSQKITVRFSPGVPDKVAQNIMLEIAHFEPVALPVYGRGVYSSVSLNLPREEEIIANELLALAEVNEAVEDEDELRDNKAAEEANEWMGLLAEAEESLRVLEREGEAKVGDEANQPQSPSEEKQSGRPVSAETTITALQPNISMLESQRDGSVAASSKSRGSKRAGGLGSTSSSTGGKSRRSARFDMVKVRREAEANRLRFVRFLRRMERELVERASSAASRPRSRNSIKSQKSVFSVAKYVMDFGNVIVGKSKRKQLKLLNTSAMPISFDVEKSAIAGSSFDVEPAKVQRLPEEESVDMTVQFVAKKGAALGATEARVPLDIRGGPPVELVLRANVTMPEVSVSSEALSFSTALVGQCRVMTVQLRNTSPVVAEWSAPIKDREAGGDLQRFLCWPASGTLLPRERVNVEVTFTPSEARDFAARLPIRVANNPHAKVILCKGSGAVHHLEIPQPLLELSPTLPSLSSTATQDFTISNDTDRDIEIYSVDFDDQYLFEERTIAAILDHQEQTSGSASKGILMTNLRAAGDPLQQSIVSMHNEILAAQEAAHAEEQARMEEAKRAESGEMDEGEAADRDNNLLEDEEAREESDAKQDEGVGELEQVGQSAESVPGAISPSYRDRGLAVDIVLHGPPLCGKFRIAPRLARAIVPGVSDSLSAPVLFIDEVTEWAAREGLLDYDIASFYELECPEPEDKKRKPNKRPMDQEALTFILRSRLASSDAGFGVVVNGLSSKYCDSVLAASAVRAAFTDPSLLAAPNDASPENGDELSSENPSASDFVPNVLRVVVFQCGQKDEYDAHVAQAIAADRELAGSVQDSFDYDAFLLESAQVANIFAPTSAASEDGAVVSDEKLKQELDQSSSDSAEGGASSDNSRAPAPLEIKPVDDLASKIFCLELMATDKSDDALIDATIAWLPEPGTPKPDDWDEFWIPIPEEKEFQIIKRAPRRAPRKPQTRFMLETIVKKPKEELGEGSEENQDRETEPKVEDVEIDASAPTRWLIPAHSELNLRVRFKSTDLGTFEHQLVFEVVGGQRQYWVVAKGLCTVPSISSDPRNVFMNRVKHRPANRLLSKKFVMSSGTYEFGPLLMGRDAAGRTPPEAPPDGTEGDTALLAQYTNLKARHCETFRISNSGILAVDEVTFGFVSDDGTSLEAEGLETTPFIVEPEVLSLNPGETKNISVWSFPQSVGNFSARLVCCVKDNPQLVEFRVSCSGAFPEVALGGPWEEPIDAAEGENDETAPPEEREKLLDFERLLLGRSEERAFTVRNTSKVTVQWKLDLGRFPELSDEFSIFPASGVLQPNENVVITVMFAAKTQICYDEKLAVLFTDIEGLSINDSEDAVAALGDALQRIEVGVKAEGYDINVKPCFLQDGDATQEEEGAEPRTLDFGTMRVFEIQTRKVKLTNGGKYSVDFKWGIRKRATRELLSVDPKEGSLEPDQEQTFTFTFASKSAAKLRNNKDIQCIIVEPKTGKVEESFEVPINAQSIYSAFRMQPTRGVHFGAVKFDSEQEKYFEIKNDEQFEFSYEILSTDELAQRQEVLNEEEAAFNEERQRQRQEYADANDGAAMPIGEQGDSFALTKQRAFAVPDPALASGDVLSLGAFSIEPRSGVLAPGSVQQVRVRYQAESDVHSLERVGVLISGRDLENSALLEGVPFELAGESHIPGINTRNFESIFEEQAIVRELNGNGTDERGVFSTESSTFSFGAVIHTSVPQRGICERFKISNPNKIKAMINFEVTPRTEASEGVFSVQPEQIELASHENAFVNVYFKPNSMSKYSAKFRAIVAEGDLKPDTSCLEFDLQGEGTLPCLTIVEPSTLTDDAHFSVEHGRTQIGKSKSRSIVVRNDGIVPATVRCDFPIDENFTLMSDVRSNAITLQPHEALSASVRYTPQTPGDHSCELSFRVLHNEFELSRFVCTGEGYQDDLTFENLPKGEEEALCFGDVPLCFSGKDQNVASKMEDEEVDNDQTKEQTAVCAEKSVSFIIRNHCAEPLRYSWNNEEVPNVCFTPSVGHLPPYGTCDITAVLTGSEPISLKDVRAVVVTSKLVYTEEAYAGAQGQSISWNDQMFSVCGESGEQNFVSEPAHEVISSNDFQLTCRAEIDAVQYERADDLPRTVQFKRTMMFQSRVFKYPIRNPGRTSVQLAWAVQPSSELSESNSHCPFAITPSQAVIEPGTEEVFTIRFAPQEVEHFEYEALASIRDLGPNAEPLTVRLQGVAKRPLCHFEIDQSNYLERRKAPLDTTLVSSNESVKVIEFDSLGIRVKNTKRFYVINPTNLAYEFELTPLGEHNSRFACITKRGVILPGKRCELAFSFTPESVETQESIWRFSIPEQNVQQVLMLAGTVSEPRVELSKKHTNFHSIMVGGQSDDTVMIVNHEHLPFSFSFDKASFQDLEGDDGCAEPFGKGTKRRKPILSVEPMSGTIGPNSSMPLTIKFAPASEKPHNFNLDCVVHRKPNRLSLNVKGEGSAIHDHLVLDQGSSDPDDGILGASPRDTRQGADELDGENSAAEMVLTAGERNNNALNFGAVHVNDRATKAVHIHNRGKFSYDYLWSLPANGVDDSLLSLSPLRGTVRPGESALCTFEFKPRREVSVDALTYQCMVAGARKYNVVVSGSGVKPLIAFSSMNFDFGPCFLAECGASSRSEEQVLTISNNEIDRPVSFDCLFEKTAFLDVSCEPTVLQPGESLQVPIRFTPRELREYSGSIPFEINGLYTVKILFSGEGTTLNLGLENVAQESLSFGSLRVGGRAAKQFKIVNRSKRVASFCLVDKDDRLAAHAVSFKPSGMQAVALRPRESCTVQLSFMPEQRYSPFSEELYLKVNGSEKKLLALTGACQAEDVKLELSALTFGDVCESCRLTRKVQIQNAGDLRAKFRWEMDRHASKNFSIFPMDGVLLPHSQLMVDVTFHPSGVADELRADVRLVADGNEQVVLPMSLTGTCMAMPEDGIRELRFDGAKVREEQSKTVEIKNPTKSAWLLQPTIHNSYWSGNKHLEVPPNGSALYEIKFCPLTMTSDAEAAQQASEEGNSPPALPAEHQGSVFFALPNGTAMMYKLLGKASAPAAEGTIEGTTAAKKALVLPLAVKNCLRTAQRMSVSIERLEGGDDHFFKGPRSVDVPGNSTRDYKLGFAGYIEGKSSAKVTFTNKVTGEYLFYFVNVEVTAPEEQDSITLSTAVRQTASSVIRIENPFYGTQKMVVFENPGDKDKVNNAHPSVAWWRCENPHVRVIPLNDIAENREGTFEVEYRPLNITAEEETVQLVLTSPQLGEYPYTLKLKAVPSQVERSLHFRSSLGSSHEQVFRFTNFTGKPTDYSCKVSHPLFFDVPPSIKAEPAANWNGTELSVLVRFEPQGLGETKDVLVVSSQDGGEYACVLYGICDPPRPSGPFAITDPAKGANIDFKNVFEQAKEFKFIVDSDDFSVNGAKSQLLKVDGGKSVSLTVKSSGNAQPSGAPLTGKLLVTCLDEPELPAWTFYIRAD